MGGEKKNKVTKRMQKRLGKGWREIVEQQKEQDWRKIEDRKRKRGKKK